MPRALTKKEFEEKKKKIKECAKELLKEHSYFDIKVIDIATKAGYSKSVIFKYFPTKETLFLDIFKDEYMIRIERLYTEFYGRENVDYTMFKSVYINHIIKSIKKDSIYAKLLLIKNIILEKKVDKEYSREFRVSIYNSIRDVSTFLYGIYNGLYRRDYMQLFNFETAILSGCLNNNFMTNIVKEVNEKEKLDAFITTYEEDVITLLEAYLDLLKRRSDNE